MHLCPGRWTPQDLMFQHRPAITSLTATAPGIADTRGANLASGNVPASLTHAESGISFDSDQHQPAPLRTGRARTSNPIASTKQASASITRSAGTGSRSSMGSSSPRSVIEDSALADSGLVTKSYTIVNPGEGVNAISSLRELPAIPWVRDSASREWRLRRLRPGRHLRLLRSQPQGRSQLRRC